MLSVYTLTVHADNEESLNNLVNKINQTEVEGASIEEITFDEDCTDSINEEE